MPALASLSDPKVYHILTYGTLLGSNLYQTFLNGPVSYKALPRASFSTLQQAIFPPYFSLQSALPILLALTWPGDKIAGVAGRELRKDSGWAGILSGENFWVAGVPVALMFLTSAVNLVWFGPATTKILRERKHQEQRREMVRDTGIKAITRPRFKNFNILHGIASATNLVGTFAALYYGAVLAERI
nr:hypothetical protein B0A51_16495 [Rachicladosporium sp. CCFEE 5018]